MDIKATIKPSDLDISKIRHLWGAFDHNETEISARWIVRFCEQAGDTWDDFAEADLVAFYREKLGEPKETFHFNRLIGPGPTYSIVTGRGFTGGGWITRDGDNLVVTAEFVSRCVSSCSKAEVG